MKEPQRCFTLEGDGSLAGTWCAFAVNEAFRWSKSSCHIVVDTGVLVVQEVGPLSMLRNNVILSAHLLKNTCSFGTGNFGPNDSALDIRTLEAESLKKR